ncbi:hypothetical protein AAG570_003408 [Ranatra chinensis]|uniref:La-related protein 7 n=1 Tax=Ranatra chinensis TaxID=642074 RepID=A0ABD0Y462_9HEMI
MENADNSDEPVIKKDRSRKKQLYQSILKQMEFYFSDANLSKDRFLHKLLEENDWIDLTVFFKFNKIRALTREMKDLVKALRHSEVLEVSEDMKVRRVTAFTPKDNEDDCVIYVEQLPPDADHNWLSQIFSPYGEIDYISIPKFKNGKVKGFAFIEFKSPEISQLVIKDYKKVGSYLSTEMAPDKLCSISTFELEQNAENKSDDFESGRRDRKRKNHNDSLNNSAEIDDKTTSLDTNGDDTNVKTKSKKRKTETAENVPETDPSDDQSKIDQTENEQDQQSLEEDVNEENGNDDNKVKKKKHRKKKKKPKKDKVTAESSGLVILSKKDWKRLRNKYLNVQKDKMKLLKKHLSQQQFRADKHKEQLAQEKKTSSDIPSSYTPGLVVKVGVHEPIVDVKRFKDDAKANPNLKYCDVKEGATLVYFRFDSQDAAKEFSRTSDWPSRGCILVVHIGTMRVHSREEEVIYWQKIKSDRAEKLMKSKKVKERGKTKLVKKAEKALGKHIVFEGLADENE